MKKLICIIAVLFCCANPVSNSDLGNCVIVWKDANGELLPTVEYLDVTCWQCDSIAQFRRTQLLNDSIPNPDVTAYFTAYTKAIK